MSWAEDEGLDSYDVETYIEAMQGIRKIPYISTAEDFDDVSEGADAESLI